MEDEFSRGNVGGGGSGSGSGSASKRSEGVV